MRDRPVGTGSVWPVPPTGRLRTVTEPPGRVATPASIGRPGAVLAVCCLVSLLSLVVGRLWPPSETVPDAPSLGWQLGAVARLALTVVTAGTLLLGPGLVLRTFRRMAAMPLGFVPLPGMALLAATGGLIWVTDGPFTAAGRARLVLAPVLIVVAIMAARLRPSLRQGEGATLALASAAFAATLGRTLWSLGPPGELYGGTISRTLEVGDRSDSRISYHVVSLVANGLNPYEAQGATLFAPYLFSDRGPLPGMISAPVALLAGTVPTAGFPDQPWSPFDGQGFMAYRVVMMMLALTALLAVHTLVRRVAGGRAALVAAAVVAGTPFFLHEIYFTWPKLCAAAMCLLAAYLVLGGRPGWAGILAGIGFLMHPLALFSVPPLILLAVFAAGPIRRHRIARMTGRIPMLAAGVAVIAYAWGRINQPHYSQDKFVAYLLSADDLNPVTPLGWLWQRTGLLANTVVPLRLPLFDPDNPSINLIGGHSSAIVHFFFQYWTGVPFAVAIVVFPFVVMALVRMTRRHPLVVIAFVLLPLLGFAIYWGAFDSGLMREGLHAWFLTTMLVVAVEITPLIAVGGRGALTLRVVLSLRLLECLAMMTVPTLVRSTAAGVDEGVLPVLPVPPLELSDAVAWSLMLAGLLALAILTLRITRPAPGSPAELTPTSPWWTALSARPDPRPRFDTPAMRKIAAGWTRGRAGTDPNAFPAQDRVSPHTID